MPTHGVLGSNDMIDQVVVDRYCSCMSAAESVVCLLDQSMMWLYGRMQLEMKTLELDRLAYILL